jgi:hypothetical protein
MEILLNGKPVERLSKRDLKSLAYGRPADEIVGAVLSAEAATAKVRLASRLLFIFLLVLVGGLEAWVSFNLAGEASSTELQLVVLFAIVVFFGLPTLFYFAHGRIVERWMNRLPERVAALPAPGAEVRLDPQGVAIGSRAAEWSQLRIDRLELIRTGGGEGGDSLIAERIVLAGAGEPLTLDANLIENGKRMVETACRRLLRANGGEDRPGAIEGSG